MIGVPNWPSARAKAYILKEIVTKNFGLKVQLQNGTNVIIFEGMNKGAMHVHPETWFPNTSHLVNKYVYETKTVVGNNPAKKVYGAQNICVTEGTARRTGIKKVEELSLPGMAALFDRDGDGRGEIWIGASGWGTTMVEKIRARSYGYVNTMEIKVMDEALAMADIDNAVVRKQNIVFCCYRPHHIFSLYKLVILQEPPHDPARWKVISPDKDPRWLEKSWAGMEWKSPVMGLHYAASLKQSHPVLSRFFSQVSFSSDQSSQMSHDIVVKKVSVEDYARLWVKENSSLVDSWLR